MIQVTTDGSCDRGRMRGAWVIRYGKDAATKLGEEGSRPFGKGTSNEAEYLALIHGCRLATDITQKGESVVVYTDSQLVVRQLAGVYRVKSKRLRELNKKARELLTTLKAKLMWHRRDEGDGPLADTLANGRADAQNGNESNNYED